MSRLRQRLARSGRHERDSREGEKTMRKFTSLQCPPGDANGGAGVGAMRNTGGGDRTVRKVTALLCPLGLLCLLIAGTSLSMAGQPAQTGQPETKGKPEEAGKPEDKARPDRPSFIPEHAHVHDVLGGRVYVVGDDVGYHPGDSRRGKEVTTLYFSGPGGRLVKKYDLFPRGFRVVGGQVKSGPKHVVVRSCCRPAGGKSGEAVGRIAILDFDGKTTWTSDRDMAEYGSEIQVDARSERLIIAHFRTSQIEIRSLNDGSLVSRSSYSDFVMEDVGDEPPAFGRSVLSEDGQYIGISVAHAPVAFTDFFLLTMDGVKAHAFSVGGILGYIDRVSSRHQVLVVVQVRPRPKRIMAYDFSGESKWQLESASRGEYSPDGNYMILPGPRRRIDLSTGRMLREP